MKLSRILMPTLKDPPGEAEIIGHQLLIRAGMLMQASSGLHRWLPLGRMVLDRISGMVEEAFENAGAFNFSAPLLSPLGENQNPEIFRTADCSGRPLILGAPSLKDILDMAGRLISSPKQLPTALYSITNCFWNGHKPRGGPVRAREYLTGRLFSFHADEESRQEFNRSLEASFEEIFKRCRIDAFKLESKETGVKSVNFIMEMEGGDREVLKCSCGFKSCPEGAVLKERPVNQERPDAPSSDGPVEVHTPGAASIDGLSEFLSTDPGHIIKAMVYMADGNPLMALIRGDSQLDPELLRIAAGVDSLEMASPEEILSFTGGPPGFSGPVGIDGSRILADGEISHIKNAVAGANRKDYHLTGVVPNIHFKPCRYANIRKVKSQDPCPVCGAPLALVEGVSLGKIENRGKINLNVNDIRLGRAVIGISRLAALTAHINNDRDGIIWPPGTGPFDVVVIPVNHDDRWQMEKAVEIYRGLNSLGVKTALEDRDRRPGFKFKDAELTGFPVRIVIGNKAQKEGLIEVKSRLSGELEMCAMKEVFKKTVEILNHQQKEYIISQECPC